MAEIGFPVFDLKEQKKYLVVCGGGGNKDYGKGNGIVVLDKKTLDVVDSFETEKLVRRIDIYSENGKTKEVNFPNAPLMADGLDRLDPKSTSSDYSYEHNSGDEGKECCSVKKEPTSSAFYILAISTGCAYVLRFDKKLKLIHSINAEVTTGYLSQNILLLINQRIYGFYNALKTPTNIKLEKESVKENLYNPVEEYVYKIYRKRNSLLPLNENCTRDIPKDWSSFFIYNNRIHKIIFSNVTDHDLRRTESLNEAKRIEEKSEGTETAVNKDNDTRDIDSTQTNDKTVEPVNIFVFKNKKYEIEGKMSNVIVFNDKLVFYSNTETEGHLYFISSPEKMFRLKRITAISTVEIPKNSCKLKLFSNESNGNEVDYYVIVSTCDGDAVIYKNFEFFQRKSISRVPVTGIYTDLDNIYFSELTGQVLRCKMASNSSIYMIALALAVLIVSIYLRLKRN